MSTLSVLLFRKSSAVLSDASIAFLQVLAIGVDDGPPFLCLFAALPSLKASCSLASWHLTAISSLLMISKMCCAIFILIDKPDDPCLGTTGWGQAIPRDAQHGSQVRGSTDDIVIGAVVARFLPTCETPSSACEWREAHGQRSSWQIPARNRMDHC